MHRACLVCVLTLCAVRPSAAEPVVVVAQLEFHSAFWINLHHLLYGAAWERRPDDGRRRNIPDMPAPLPSTLSGEERAAWESAVDYYDRTLASRDLLTGMGMMQ